MVIESNKKLDSLDQKTTHTYQGKEYKYQELNNFMEKFARSEWKEEPQQYISKKEDEKLKQEDKNQQRSNYIEIQKNNFTSEVLETSDACLVYFTTLE